jgi:hypothetical protein
MQEMVVVRARTLAHALKKKGPMKKKKKKKKKKNPEHRHPLAPKHEFQMTVDDES